MSENSISYLTDVVMISCVVAHGRGDEVIKVARETGVTGALVYNGRGSGMRERLGLLAIAVDAEKDVVNMLASTNQRDQVMQTLYTQLDLDRPGAGVIYTMPLDKVATYIPADILQNMQKDTSE